MKTSVSTFTTVYTQWLDSFRALLPGGSAAAPAAELTRKQEQAAAHQEWEDEGGCIKPAETKPGLEPAPKLPI